MVSLIQYHTNAVSFVYYDVYGSAYIAPGNIDNNVKLSFAYTQEWVAYNCVRIKAG